MRHARPDYAPIQDPRGKIPEDEPVFLLRGQDEIAPYALQQWVMMAMTKGVDPTLVNMATDQVEAMHNWQRHRGRKMPDFNRADAPFDPLRDGTPSSRGMTLSRNQFDALKDGLEFMRDKASDLADKERLKILLQNLGVPQ